MADISIIEKIANGQVISPITDYAQVADTNKIFKRTGSSPADVTEIFMNKSSAEAYAKGELDEKYQDGLVSYVGQHITVVDKDAGTATMYLIQNTAGTLKLIAIIDDITSISSTIAENYLSVSQAVEFAPASISSTIAENYLSTTEFSTISANFLTENEITGKVDKFTEGTNLNLDDYTLGNYLIMLANRLSGGVVN